MPGTHKPKTQGKEGDLPTEQSGRSTDSSLHEKSLEKTIENVQKKDDAEPDIDRAA